MAIIFCNCSPQKRTSDVVAPVSDLGHVDLVLDSAAFYAIVSDSFLTKEFSVFFQDTTMYSKPSYDLYLLGSEAFLHISLAKEYWENKAGSGVMIFQTRKPEKHDSLLLAWKHYFKDSLSTKNFEGGDFLTGEVLPYRKKDPSKPAEPNFTPILMSYSVQGFKNWGFSDSIITNGVSMQEFMHSWDTTSQEKLFQKIKALHVQVTKQEFAELESALYAMGYTFHTDHFMHEFNPDVHYTVTEFNVVPKYTRIEIELSEPTAKREIRLGTMYTIHINGKEMIIEQVK